MIATTPISHPDRDPQGTTTRRRFDGNPQYSESAQQRKLCRGDGEEAPLAGHALELVSAALLELKS